MMAVVLIVGLLAVIATVGYRKWVLASRGAEATNILGDIRAEEERVKSETNAYLDVSGSIGVGNTYPATNPGNFVTAWGAACGTCPKSNAWAMLNIAPTAPVMFGYAVIADPAAAPNTRGIGNNVKNAGQAVDMSSLTGSPWYVAQAIVDRDNNGVYWSVTTSSSSNQIFVDNEGE
jgi:type IV pilus assembly protein PilA